jgi:hypothetical protein
MLVEAIVKRLCERFATPMAGTWSTYRAVPLEATQPAPANAGHGRPKVDPPEIVLVVALFNGSSFPWCT